ASRVAEQVTEVAAGRDGVAGVVYLWGLDAVVKGSASAGEVGEATRRATASLLGLVQAFGTGPRPPRLWVVTRGACVVGGGGGEPEVAPCQAALWGLGRVAALEHPAAWGGVRGLGPQRGSAEGFALAEALLGAGADGTRGER